MVCEIPPRDAKEDRIHFYLGAKHDGLAELYEAMRLVRTLPQVPGAGLMQAHLVREIKNGLVNVTLAGSTRTEPWKLLADLDADWKAVWPTLRAELEKHAGDPSLDPIRKSSQRIVDRLDEYRRSAQTSVARTANMFSVERGLRVDPQDPSVRHWEAVGNRAHGSAHFPRTKEALPAHEKTAELVELLEIGLDALSLEPTEGLDEVDALLQELDS